MTHTDKNEPKMRDSKNVLRKKVLYNKKHTKEQTIKWARPK